VSEYSAPEFPGLDDLPDHAIDAYVMGRPFETGTHTQMIRSGSQPSFCINRLANAQWRQDVVLSTWAPAHFDNCRFDDSQRYLAELIAAAEKAAASGKRDDMLVALGRGLHGVQDFYSHSNYVELMALKHPTLSEVPIVEVWQPDGAERLQKLVAEGLISGHVFWEPGNACKEPVKSHADLSKDSPGSTGGAQVIEPWKVTAFRAAQELAIRATRAYLQAFLSRPAWATLVKDCKGLAFTTMGDRRSSGAHP
jgi:hypothetical protein